MPPPANPDASIEASIVHALWWLSVARRQRERAALGGVRRRHHDFIGWIAIMLGRRERVVAEVARIFRQRVEIGDDAGAVGRSAGLDALGEQLDRIDPARDPPQQ